MDINLENKTDLQSVLINYPTEVYPAKEMFIAWLQEKGGPEAVELFTTLVACEYFCSWNYKILEKGYRLSEMSYKLITSNKRKLAWTVKRFKLKFPMDFHNG